MPTLKRIESRMNKEAKQNKKKDNEVDLSLSNKFSDIRDAIMPILPPVNCLLSTDKGDPQSDEQASDSDNHLSNNDVASLQISSKQDSNMKQNFTEDLSATTHCPLFSSIGQTASTEAKENTTSTTDHLMTNEQAKHIISLCHENNKMLKSLMQYHGIVEGSQDSATLARKKLKYDCDNMHTTKAVEISPVSIRKKQKKVLHVVGSEDRVMNVINTVGFWTLQYIVPEVGVVSLFVPSVSTWFSEYVDKASMMHEPANMTDCMVQMLSRLANHVTQSQETYVVPFALEIDHSMKRDEICHYFQQNTFLLSDMPKLNKKQFAVAIVTMDGEFAVLLYHIGNKNNGYYYGTATLFCQNKTDGEKYCIAGICDYMTMMLGLDQQYNRTTYRVCEFDDTCKNIEAYLPWSIEEFRQSNFPYLCGSHMMTIKLVLSFVASVSSGGSVLNDIHSELILWPSKYIRCRKDFHKLRFQLSVACYQIMIHAIAMGLYKPVRDELGQWSGHLDPSNTCQDISIMIKQKVDDIEGMNILIFVNFTASHRCNISFVYITDVEQECTMETQEIRLIRRPTKRTVAVGLTPQKNSNNICESKKLYISSYSYCEILIKALS